MPPTKTLQDKGKEKLMSIYCVRRQDEGQRKNISKLIF